MRKVAKYLLIEKSQGKLKIDLTNSEISLDEIRRSAKHTEYLVMSLLRHKKIITIVEME